MIITGIEVIRGNPEVAPITNNPGFLVEVAPPGKLEVTYGQTLRITTSFDYRGPAQTATLYGAIGNRGFFGFGEILANQASIEVPESPADFTPCVASVDVPITSEISPGTDYDLYVKIKEYPEAGLPEVDDVIDIVGVAPEFELVEYIIYPQAYLWE
ncbi:unnamed protein product, partial [marine sediment metagenome]